MPLVGWAFSRHPSSKWGGLPANRQPWLLGIRGVLLYLPLAISLYLNSLWVSSFLNQEGALLSGPRSVGAMQGAGKDGTCGQASLRRAQKHLSDVVLVVSFVDDATARNASSLVRAIYGRFFLEVIVCAPTEDKELGIEGRGPRSWGKNPSYQYYFFPRVAARYQTAAGFLFTAADVLVHYWNLVEANKSRLWLPDVPGCPPCRPSFVPLNTSGSPAGPRSPLENSIQKKGVSQALQRMEPEQREQLERSLLPKARGYPTRVGDVFYVPQRHALQLALDLIPPFRDFAVFQDIAVPAMFYALEPPTQFDPVLSRLVFVPEGGGQGAAIPESRWREATASHPWALLTLQDRARLLATLSKEDACVRRLVGL